jgi:hypothetical protein
MTFYHYRKKFKWPWYISLYYKPRQYPGFTRANVRQTEDWLFDRDRNLAHRDDRYNWLNTWSTPGLFQYWIKENFFKRLSYEFNYIKWLFSCYIKLYVFEYKYVYLPLNYYKKRILEVIKWWLPTMYIFLSFIDWLFFPLPNYLSKFESNLTSWIYIFFGIWFSYLIWVVITLIFPSFFSYIDERPELMFGIIPMFYIWPDWFMWDIMSFAWMKSAPIFYFFCFVWVNFTQHWACEEEPDDSVNPDQVEIYLWSPFHPAYYFWEFETVFNASGTSYHDWLILGEGSLFKKYDFYNTYLRAFFYENPLRHTRKSYMMWRRFFR